MTFSEWSIVVAKHADSHHYIRRTLTLLQLLQHKSGRSRLRGHGKTQGGQSDHTVRRATSNNMTQIELSII
jgi:hypothetical protein